MKNNLNKREKYLAGAAVVLLLIFILARTVVLPQVESYYDTVEELQVARARLVENSDMLLSLEKEEKDKEFIDGELAAIEKLFYTNKPGEKIISDIVLQAEKEMVSIIYIQSLSSNEGNYYSEIPVKINVRGAFENVTGFIRNLEDFNEIKIAPEVKELDIFLYKVDRAGGDVLPGTVEAQLILGIYVLNSHKPANSKT